MSSGTAITSITFPAGRHSPPQHRSGLSLVHDQQIPQTRNWPTFICMVFPSPPNRPRRRGSSMPITNISLEVWKSPLPKCSESRWLTGPKTICIWPAPLRAKRNKRCRPATSIQVQPFKSVSKVYFHWSYGQTDMLKNEGLFMRMIRWNSLG